MIDSVIWKEKLKQDLRALKKRQSQKRWSNRSFILFERELILAFFSIRKLIESRKVTDRVANRKYKCKTYPNKGMIVDELSKYDLEENFDFESEEEKSFSLTFLANQFIHAYVLFPDFSDDGKILGILLCSDWEKHNSLIQIKIEDAISMVEDVINDYVRFIRTERDPDSGELHKTEIK